MTEQELQAKLDAAEKSPDEITHAAGGQPDSVLRYKPSPDKWCILEIVGHLADVEIVFSHRLRQILADQEATIAPIDQDAWAGKLGYMQEHLGDLLARYQIDRKANVRLLRRIKMGDLERSAYHPELKQPVTLAALVDRIVAHSASHLQQIERLKQQAKAASAG